MVQSIVMVVVSYPLLLDGFTQLVMLGNQHIWTDPRATGVVVEEEEGAPARVAAVQPHQTGLSA